MRILITGAKGFIGKNLIVSLKQKGYNQIYTYDIDNTPQDLELFVSKCDFIYHLAATHRPKDERDYDTVNRGLTEHIIELAEKHNNKCPILLTSSIQATDKTSYGRSKVAGELAVINYAKRNGTKAIVYRLTNTFGKWATPNSHSVVATFCYNISRDIPINITDKKHLMQFYYIDDVIDDFVNQLNNEMIPDEDGYFRLSEEKIYTVTLGDLASYIYRFNDNRKTFSLVNNSNVFIKRLYSTYLSYLPIDKFSSELNMNIDERGSFTELVKTIDAGQVSVNVLKPGVTKGNHWHRVKIERFLVVNGEGVIHLRNINDDEIIKFKVSSKNFQIIDIPVGYTHNIKNIGVNDLVAIMWSNQYHDSDELDTYSCEV